MRPTLLILPFGLPIYAYGLMLTLSVLAGRLIAIRLAARVGISATLAERCATWTFIGAILGARLLFVVTNLDAFGNPLDFFAWWKGGVVAYGGFLGGLAGAIGFCRINRMPLLAWADCVAPSLCVGLAITRVGCFLAGCDFGRPWDGPWSVRFPAGSLASVEQARLGLIPTAFTPSLPVHPTQLYEALTGLALLWLVLEVRRRQKTDGMALMAFAIGYGVLRFLIEMVRADPGRGAIGVLSTSQIIAVATVMAAATFTIAAWRQYGDRAFHAPPLMKR